MSQRVAVIGAGAVGCYYGARLAEAGHEVHFLLRSQYETVASTGLHVQSRDGDCSIPEPLIHRDAAEIGAVDWVLCAIKATALEQARDLIAPCVGPQTRILALMNGLGIEDRLGEWFGAERVFGGLAFTCINRDADGRIHHLDYGDITLAHLADDPEALAEAHALWADACVNVETTPSLLAARWTKLCWNIPFNGLTVACGGITTDRVMASELLRAEAEALIREIVAVANADLAVRWQTARLIDAQVVESMMSRTEAMAVYSPSTTIDFVEGRPMEVEAIFGEPVHRAGMLEVPAPRMSLLYAQMQTLDGLRERE